MMILALGCAYRQFGRVEPTLTGISPRGCPERRDSDVRESEIADSLELVGLLSNRPEVADDGSIG